MSPNEQWYGIKPDLEKYPMLPFGAIAMAHIPLFKQSVGTPRAELTYAVLPCFTMKVSSQIILPQKEKLYEVHLKH